MTTTMIRSLNESADLATSTATEVPNATASFHEAELVEEEHVFDAISSLALNITLIACLLMAYFVRRFRIYYLPESAGALIIGMVIGGIARLTVDDLKLFEFSPEVFFFFLLPPIIFEAGYSLDRKGFFQNIGAITLYAILGTMISTFTVGILCFYAAKVGLIRDIDVENPMEALLFGALISAVDPVATLSILGNAELHCDPLLYSLVFGESVLNDAIAISLFKTFFKFYNPDGPDWSESEIPNALLSFIIVSSLSIVLGVGLGLGASWLYKHTELSDYPSLETALLLCFCYLCYSGAEAVGLSGILSIFFQAVVLSHYNSYNLSATAHVASEQIFSTFATLTETMVFIYMGMGVFTGRFQNWDIKFSILALAFTFIGRFLNIIPLSWLANQCRRGQQKIPGNMQVVLWFAGLRGAIAFALAENMPGPNKEVYATATLSICIFTTVICGGFTERMLTVFGMKGEPEREEEDEEGWSLSRLSYTPPTQPREGSVSELARRHVYEGVKGIWNQFDDQFLKPHFGGSQMVASPTQNDSHRRGNYELGVWRGGDGDEEDEEDEYEDM
jgi:sodium/hydrogen exchanger 8